MINIINLLHLFNVVFNTISAIFTLLFILYRFTNLFSYVIGFIKFCGKLMKGVFYIKNKLSFGDYRPYIVVNSEEDNYDINSSDNDNDNDNNSIFNKARKYISNAYYYIFPKKKEYNILPVYEMRESYIDGNSVYSGSRMENNILNTHINNLMLNNSVIDNDNVKTGQINDEHPQHLYYNKLNDNYNDPDNKNWSNKQYMHYNDDDNDDDDDDDDDDDNYESDNVNYGLGNSDTLPFLPFQKSNLNVKSNCDNDLIKSNSIETGGVSGSGSGNVDSNLYLNSFFINKTINNSDGGDIDMMNKFKKLSL